MAISSAVEAAMAGRWMGAEVAVPIHYHPESKAPEEFAAHVSSEIAKWARVVKISGARAD